MSEDANFDELYAQLWLNILGNPLQNSGRIIPWKRYENLANTVGERQEIEELERMWRLP